MNMEEALLQAIHEAPADESPWRVLGDWLEDQGAPERAELLRLSLALRREAEGPAARQVLEGRLRALLAAGARPCVPGLVNSIGMPLVLVPPGTFLMGSPDDEPDRSLDEGPQYEVTIARPFYLGAHPITQRQYQEVVGSNPSCFSPGGDGKGRVQALDTGAFPVESVSWEEAVTFCAKLSGRRHERSAGRSYRLPTEAEWEYACRAGTTTPFHFGPSLTTRQANVEEPSGEAQATSLKRTTTVGSYPPNAWGLYDMHGNVDEWCCDGYVRGYYDRCRAQGSQGPGRGDWRVVRGGSWLYRAASSRAACRGCFRPEDRRVVVGFRVVCVTGPI